MISLFISDNNEFIYDSYNEVEDVLTIGSYGIPLFWFTLYFPEDACIKEIKIHDGFYSKCPVLVISSSVAKSRVKDRKQYILSVLPKK